MPVRISLEIRIRVVRIIFGCENLLLINIFVFKNNNCIQIQCKIPSIL